MAIFTAPKLSKRFQMSYKAKEVLYYEELENRLMEKLCIPTRADLHKKAVRTLDSFVKSQNLSIV